MQITHRLIHRLRTAALVAALFAVPLGVAHAEDGKDVDWDALETRIEEAVKRGDLTREEADAKYAAIRKRMASGKTDRKKSDVDWEGVKRRLDAAVEKGDLTRAEADRKLESLRRGAAAGRNADPMVKAYAEMGIDAKTLGRIKERLTKNGFTTEQLDDALGATLRIAHEAKREGDAFELDPRLKAHLVDKMGLTAQQVEVLTGMGRRVAVAAARGGKDGAKGAGPSKEEMAAVKKRIWEAVASGDLTEEQAKERWSTYLDQQKKQRDAAEEDEHAQRREAAVVKEKLDAAVKAGRITQEQADARWKRYLEALGK